MKNGMLKYFIQNASTVGALDLKILINKDKNNFNFFDNLKIINSNYCIY